ncbi:MAG: ABC transporter permease [Bacteroidales bacterium]|nr:ABC transporter permease [Bacteroidales bacterium]
MSKLGLIIEREYLSRVRKKTFIILTILTPLLLAALVAVPLLLSFIKGSEVRKIAVSDHSGLYFPRLESNDQYLFVPATDSFETYKQHIKDHQGIYAYLVINGNLSSDSAQVAFYSGKQIEMELKGYVTHQLENMVRDDKINSYNIPGLKKIIEDSNPKISLNTIKWDENGDEKESSSELAMFIGMLCTMIIYIFIFAYGAMVMNGVIEEKTNRIVEVIISSVKPFELMMGKIIGIALVGLTQVLLWVVLIGGILVITGVTVKDSLSPEKMEQISTGMATSQGMHPESLSSMQMTNTQDMTNTENESGPDINEIYQMISNINLGEICFWFILYFLGGYLLYASLFAAVGSAIDSQEDAAQFTMPLTIPVLFALYAGIYSASNPDGPLAMWCSMIPFTSPIVMMVRLPFGVPWWQLLLSFGLLIITFVLTTKFAAKIYRTGILMYGKKVSYKELWKWLKYKN